MTANDCPPALKNKVGGQIRDLYGHSLAVDGKYADVQELTPYMLRELVKAVYVSAPDKSSGKRVQNIHISYDLVGFIPVDELMKKESA